MTEGESRPYLRLAAGSGDDGEAGMSQRSRSRLAPVRGDSASAAACDSSGDSARGESELQYPSSADDMGRSLARSLAAASSVPTPARPEQRTEPRLASPPPNARGSGWLLVMEPRLMGIEQASGRVLFVVLRGLPWRRASQPR